MAMHGLELYLDIENVCRACPTCFPSVYVCFRVALSLLTDSFIHVWKF